MAHALLNWETQIMRALPCAHCGKAARNTVEPPSSLLPTLVSPSLRVSGRRLSYRAERQLQAALDGRRCRGQVATSAMPAATLGEHTISVELFWSAFGKSYICKEEHRKGLQIL